MSVLAAPDSTRCPNCAAPLAGPHCGSCGIALDGAAGEEIWRIDHELHRLSAQRASIIQMLVAAAAPATERPPPPTGAGAPAPVLEESRSPLGVPTLLLGLGALSLITAVIIFAAVAWGSLGEAIQVGLLIGSTGAMAALAVGVGRAGLERTAEVLGALAVAVGVVTVATVQTNLLSGNEPALVWATGLAVVVAGSLVLHRVAALVSPAVIGLGLGVLPGTLIAGHVLDRTVTNDAAQVLGLGAVLLTQSIAFVLVAGRWASTRPGLRSWAAVLGLLQGGLAAAIAVLTHQEPGLALPGSALLVAVTAIGVAVTVRWQSSEGAPFLAAASATVVTFLPSSLLRDVVDGVGNTSLLVLATGVLTGGGAAIVHRRQPLATGALIGATWVGSLIGARWAGSLIGSTAVPVAAVASALGLAAGAGSWPAPWSHQFATSFAALSPDVELGHPARTVGFVVVALAATALLPITDGRARRVVERLIVAVSVPAVLAAIGRPIGETIGLALVVAVGATGAALGGRRTGASVGAAWSAATAALLWAPLSELTTIGVLSVLTASAIALTLVASAVRRPGAAALSTTTACTGTAMLAVIWPAALDATVPVTWIILPFIAMAWGLAGLAIRVRGLPARWHGFSAVATALETTAIAAVSIGSIVLVINGHLGLTILVLVSAALCAGVHALTGLVEGPATLVAASAATAAAWTIAARAEIDVVEAYTLPLAAALLIVGLRRFGHRGSWMTSGLGLAVGLVPTVLLAYVEGGVTRSIVAALGSAAVLAHGGLLRRQASLTIGGACLTAILVHQLANVVAELPRWIVFGGIGIALLALGATYEQRAADMVRLGRRFRALT